MKLDLLLTLALSLVWSNNAGRPAGKPMIGGPTAPDGKAVVTCDLPVEMRHLNVGGTDGAGLCVWASLDHAALFQNDERTVGIFGKMRKERGGGWPTKVDRMMPKYAAGAKYVQYQGRNPAILDLAIKTGRMPCVLYRQDHMVNLVHLDAEWACVLDNNHIGERELRWFKRDEFLKSWWTDGGTGWAIVLLAPRPPAPPRNEGAGPMKESFVLGCAGVGCLMWGLTLGNAIDMAGGDSPPKTNGVVFSPSCKECERCACNGCECSYDEMLKAVGQGGEVPDDSAWPSLTFIGSKEETGRARGALEEYPSTAELMKRYCVQEFRPTNPLVSRAGFLADGKPTIYGQRRDGRVMFRLDSFPGADALAETMQAGLAAGDGIRRPDPLYQPAADSGLVVPLKPQVNADITPAPWMLVLSHAASLLVGGMGALGGRWAIISLLVGPMVQAVEDRLAARLKPPAPPAPPAVA